MGICQSRVSDVPSVVDIDNDLGKPRVFLVEGGKGSQMTLLYIEVASLVLMFACIDIWVRSAYLAYVLSVAVVSLAACLLIQTGEFVKPGLLEKVEKPVSMFLFVWWAVGTGVITFKGPFLAAGNGYFSTWAGLIFAAHWALNIDTSKFTDLDNLSTSDKGRKILVVFAAAGVVLFIACIPHLTNYTGQSAWGITAGLITLIMGAVLFKVFDEMNGRMLQDRAIVLFIIWATVAGVCTFDGPFILAGNGYFASWGGFVTSTYFLNFAMALEDELV